MKTLKQLLEERAAAVAAQNDLIEAAEGQSREFTEDESKRFDELQKNIDDLDGPIQRARRVEAAKKAKAEAESRKIQQQKPTPEERAANRYSITRAIQRGIDASKPLDGLELEMHQEAEREASAAGTSVSGIGVPSWVFAARNLEVATPTAGGNTVETELGGLIPTLRPRLRTASLGITTIGGLQGNVEFPRHTDQSQAEWEGEITSAKETKPGFDKIGMSPNRLAAFTRFSLQLIRQSSLAIDRLVRDELSFAIAQKVDSAVINGTGVGQPLGILQAPNLQIVSMGDNGGAPDRGHLIDLNSKIATANADVDRMGFLTTPLVRGLLQKTKKDAGSGFFVWDENQPKTLMSYNAEVSTQVPSNLTKGTGTDLHALLFGNYAEYLLGNWGPVDMVVDPYTLATEGMIKITVNTFWDGNIRHDEAFAAIKDIAAAA